MGVRVIGDAGDTGWILIAPALVTSTTNSSVTFQNIPQGFVDLKLVWNEVVASSYHHIRMNADTLNHDYPGGGMFGFGASANTSGQIYANSNASYIGVNSNQGAFIAGSVATQRSYGSAVFIDYQSSGKKAIKWENWSGGGNAFPQLSLGYSLYVGTSPITSFEIKNFFSGAGTIYGNFYLYGSKISR